MLAIGTWRANRTTASAATRGARCWGMDGYFLMPWSVLLDPTFSGDFRTIYRSLS